MLNFVFICEIKIDWCWNDAVYSEGNQCRILIYVLGFWFWARIRYWGLAWVVKRNNLMGTMLRLITIGKMRLICIEMFYILIYSCSPLYSVALCFCDHILHCLPYKVFNSCFLSSLIIHSCWISQFVKLTPYLVVSINYAFVIIGYYL
jgi:hypothetical protein